MAFSIPDGTTVFLGTSFAAALPITEISNANPAVVSSAGHGLSAGAIVIIRSGWQRINERVFRVANPLAGTFELEGEDTSDTSDFPVGGSAGEAEPVTGFTQITQIIGLETSGGEPKYVTISPLESDQDINIPAGYNAQSIEMDIGDDPNLLGYKALKAAANARAMRPLKMVNKNNSMNFYYGYVAMNETPTKSKGSVETVKASLSLQSRPVRYAS